MKALEKKIKQVKKEAKQLNDKLSRPDSLSRKKIAQLSKKQAKLSKISEKIDRYRQIKDQLKENKKIIKSDSNLASLAKEENQELKKEYNNLKQVLITDLVTADKDDEKNVILEIRAGTGGEEAELFAGDLYRMYKRYCHQKGFSISVSNMKRSDIGGLKEIIAEIKGEEVFKNLKYEGGVHRVQRVPKTEKSGRIHTSAATVAILPIAEKKEVKIKPNQIEVATFRSSGPGGQSVNTTDSAVRITHKPTGISVSCQDEKSQLKNKEKAMKILRSRLLENERQKTEKKQGQTRRTMIGSGDRSEKIRTYNFPQNRVSDHRINFTTHKLEEVMDGSLDIIIDKLQKEDQKRQLTNLT